MTEVYKYSINELNQMAYDYRHGVGSYQRQETVIYSFLQNATYNGGYSNNYSSIKPTSSNNYNNNGSYSSSRWM
jgi:hypothetical protein